MNLKHLFLFAIVLFGFAGAQIDYLDKSRLDPSTDTLTKIDRAVALVMLDEINILRAKSGLPQRTTAQLKSAVTAKFKKLSQ